MLENEDKIKKLYDTFVSDGYDMESEEDFRKNLSDSTKRRAAYDALVKDGYEMEPFEEFENNIGFGKIQTPVPEPAVQTEQVWQPTEQEKAEMIASTNRMMQNVETQIQDANERVDNIQEYGLNPGLQTKEGKMQFNPENGKLEKTYITPLGNKTTSKPLADIESFRYRQAADMSIGGQLRKANLRLQELKAKQAERASEVHKEWVEETEKNKAPLAAILGAATYTPRQQSDKENSALRVAIRETEELIKNLEEQKDRENGVDVGFWRGFGRTMGDVRTWDFGMGDMADTMTMMNADKLKGDNATEGERESHDMMMGAIHEKQQAEERYGGNADFWNRAGVMTGYMPSFMLDFILTGGGFNGLSTFSKGSTKVAAKVIGKETAEKMAQQGFKSYIKENGVRGLGQYATDWTIKALGTTADDLLVRAPLMTNTIQAGKTVSDIIDRKLGDVVVDENGNYDFSNDKTWGSAIWQGEANAIIENYSEMFGAHLDPILTLGNMSKLANVLGAKRLGGVLSKADVGTLNSIMGQTHQMFNKMGVSDYVGEVSEEYYGQLWRTMLSLDDAYQQNPDGTRTNLFATGQFHGDIWGGMALSMGLMGAGKHTLSAANYASMKHGVNKTDAKVNELLGKEVWEPLKATLDLTTNENIGEVAELVAGDKDFTADEKAAVLNYMERSLNLRGFNLASMARSRGGVQSESEQQANDSYLDGYNVTSSQEMNDAKNLYEYHRTQVADLADENMFAMIEENPIAALEFVNGNEQWSDEDKSSVIDYINAKQVYNGMIQRVRDDIDGRVEQSNSMIDARVNRKTGMIQGATMKQDERKVYVLSGTLVPYADGSGVSVTDSDNSIIVRDADTGGLEQVSPDAILSIDDVQDPYEQKELAAQSIREQFAREAADKIDGVVTFNPGETYTIASEGGSQIQVTIVSDENGIIDNGDGTINVTDGTNVFPIAKEAIQQFVDASNIARIAEFEQQRVEENFALQQEEQEADRPQYAMNDLVTLRDENGIGIRGNITADVDADGLYEVYTEDALNGKRVNMFTREELDSMLIEHNGQPVEIANSSVNDNSEVAASSLEEQQLQVSALERIPKDEQGNPIYEQAETPDLAWDAIVEQTEGDEAMAQSVANGMVADKEAALKKIEKTKSAGGNTIAEKIVAEKERKAAIDVAKQELSIWQKIAGTANRRKMEADAERRRIADEATALRKAEEEKLRAEREEAERKEREALNGVPDIVEDVPKDARARGYRRVNGHKVDRQEPLQTVQGKEVNVKFSNDVVVPGNVTVIDASLLQPSHIQGVRNSLHFIDEAQPKERNDEASVLSARKIAENIRPEEITSSITAYTGAPTVNERGEVIQGNNRSDALRLMWESHSEQAEAYRQYLKDHAEEFGLRAEDIAPIQSPVLVNMLHVDDTEALNLGQFVAQDTESGGVERIKPKNTLQRMGTEMRSFANLLLRTSDDEMSFAGLVDANGANVLKWMSQRGFISHTQYKSAFDSKGNLTPESKNDLRGIMYQSIFKDGSTRLEEMFNVLPVKAQKAILATAFRDYDSPNSERMVDEIQNSVRAYYALSQYKMFAEAKNFKEARIAVENWKRQYQMDDVTGESYLPADNFSNFVLHLAAMYKGESQSFIQNTFGKIYDLIQGTQEETLFEQPDNTPRTLVQAIKEALNLDYNGQQRSNVLVGDTATSQRGQQGSNGDLAPRERVKDGNGTIDDTGRTQSIGEQSEIEPSLSQEEMLSSGDTDNQLSAKIARRIEVQEDDWVESGKYGDTYKQTIIVDGTHKVIKVDAPDAKGNYTGSTYEYDGQTFGDLLDVVNYIDASSSLANAVAVAEKETDTTPTEKQKEAGNYKKGHVQVGTFNITIENPKGSVRSGIDTEGNKWETTMQNTYGYIRGTEGVDGDHIDVFLSDDIDGWNGRKVFVVDQYNEDGTFDEHKVMLGFNEADDAEAAYFANYDRNWAKKHKTMLTGVNLEEFEKWIESSHRKTKAFANYANVRGITYNVDQTPTNVNEEGMIVDGEGKPLTLYHGTPNDVEFRDLEIGHVRESEDVPARFNGDGISFTPNRSVAEDYASDGESKGKVFEVNITLKKPFFTIGVANFTPEEASEFTESLQAKGYDGIINYSSKTTRELGYLPSEVIVFDIKSASPATAEANGQQTENKKVKSKKEAQTQDATPRQQRTANNQQPVTAYTITPAQYTTKRGKVLDMQIVKFGMELSKDEFRSANAFAKSLKGWYDAKQRGFLMRSEDDAKQLVDAVIPKEDAALSVTQSEDSENAVENTPQAGEDIFQMAERIAKEEEEKRRASKENARKAEEAGKEPVSLEHWKRMDGDARMAEAGKRPLTREEIESASTDEVLKANALDYLDGNQGMIQSISYLKVYEDVRYPNRTAAADSGATDSAQLDTPALGNEQRVDVRDRGQSGNSNARLDRETGEEGVPAEGGPLHADPSDARSDATGNGNGGSETLPVRESVLQPGDSRGDVHSGSSVRSGEGRDVGGRTGRKNSTTSRKNSKWGVQADTARNAKNDRGLDLNDPLDKELADALKEFDSVLDEFNRAGREELSMSLVGMNSRQMEVLPRLVSAGAKVGYAYIKKGAHNFAEWAKRMREALGGKLKDAGLGENEIDAFIKEMWKSKLPMDGEVHTVEEWAGIIGKVELRKKVGESLEEKRKAQRAAEPIPVKTCDRENIVETLPFLLPQQQDDVLKAETQFFDESHDDRDHAFGKGYMFTNGTGTGKTYTGLGIVKRFIKQGKGRILILTPSQTKVKDWIEDAANLDIELNDLDKTAKARKDGTTAITEKGEGAVITTYANFRQNKALLEDLFDLIVYDESHRLLENKGGVGTTGSMQHYKLSNRNEQFAFLRLQDINPTWNELNAKNEEFSTQRDAIIKRIEKESGTTNELTLGQRGELPPVFNGNWTQGMELKFPELAKLRNECLSLDAKYAKEVKPELERQAKENVKHTKVVFLSATPFNTRENLDYVEGYIFSYPEKEKQDGYSTQSPRSQFYLEHFGAGYKWRYHRLESSGSNPEAVSKQEVEFSNYLQHTLQTMSGRIIDSPFDYSRNFPTVTLDKAEEFNNAMEELSRNKATSYAYHEVMGNYNYTSALFESMKVTQIIPRLKEHFVRGRKAVIFHRRVESKNPLVPPFKTIFDVAVQSLKEEYDATKKAENKKEIARLRRKYAGMLEWEQTLDLRMPREQLADAFGKNNVLFFSGKESKKIKDKAVEDFNNDASGKNVIVIQEDSGKEGISLHDTTGEHQRVLVTLALPQSPITALQIEGRIYRIGNKSNAIFEYPLLGLNTELMLFGQKFNQQVSTTENLALGSQARNLRESFARGVEEHSGNVDIDNQGVGGKEFDTPSHTETNAFDSAVLDYYTNQKLSGKRDSREGTDYYPTPEPLGFMMNQWGRIGDGESVLEPSAGHGAIARYVPRENPLTAVEPSQSLFSKLQIKAGGNGRKFENTIFEDYNVVNKHDVVLMNPPFGAGGRLAVDHVAKAFQHLEEGGRIVAIIPRGSTDKKFDKWYEEQKGVVLTAEIGLPDITFERAGTSVNCRVVVIDKVTNEILRQDAASRAVHMDLSGEHYEKIEDFFEEIRNIDVPERTIDHKAKLKKKAAPTARELRTVKGINYVSLTEDGISVSGRGVWGGLEWKDKTGKALINYLADQYRRFKSNYDYAVRDRRETQEAAYGEMKELACKLAGMTEDEMQRYIDKKSGDDMLYRSDELIESINEQFNEELQQQIDGTLPKGHIYQLGNPGNVLLGTGVPNLPIQLNSTRLIDKATRFGHNYGLEEIKDLVVALQSPIAVFAYGDKSKGQNIIVELSSNDKNFVVGMSLNPTVGGKTLEINSIRNVFPKDNAEWLNWITQEKLLYVDKERIQNLIDQQRTILADVDYLDLDSVTKIVESFENPSVERENLREGEGVYTDERLSYENDPAAKMQGKTRRTVKQQREFAERERQRMFERVKKLAKKLHLDNVDIITDTSTLEGKKQRAKGFYSKNTGKITIVIPNHTSMFDVEQTLLHEAVAHYGLRRLFGEHFDTFLDNVFNNADEIIRRRIVDMTSKNGWDFRKATEEYLASLAETTEFENTNASWWHQIKNFFLNMLHKIGFEDFRGVTLTDNELRYILWRSYENLAEPSRYRSILGEATDMSKQYELKVGNYAEISASQSVVAETDDNLYRDGDPEIHEKALARDRYERRVRSGMYQSQEALQDSMLGLKEAMTAILGKNTRMEDVDGFENAYLGENRLSSVNKAEADAFAHLLFKPMLEEIARLAHSTAEREELTDYMMAKHGLERNRVMAERDAQKDFAEYQKQHPKGTKALQDFIDECRKRDYAGLTALTSMEEIVDAEAEAKAMVDEYENAHDTTALWSKVNAVSKAILSKSYECGMMSKETYDSVRDMYEFYIPLRGFDEKTSAETYAYLTHKQSIFNAPIKKAEGRRSKADDPFANLQSMAESAIMQGNRNKLVKQKFLNFALNHPSDLVSVSDLWLQYDAVSDEWKPIFPDNIDINDSPEEVERKMNEFEDKMKQLAESAPDNYKHGKDAANIPYRVIENRDLRQHQVVVKRNGRDYVITINGNPRAAQALNGQTNPDNDISGSIGQLVHLIGDVNRTLSSLYTTLQPDFIASNFLRDMLYSNSMVWVKESPKYAMQYNRNFAKLPIARMVVLLDKYRRRTLDMNDETEKMFYQFMMNGGETGFSRMADIDEHKKEIKKMLKTANEKIPAHVVRECMANWIGEVGRGIEMRARFAAFVTSRNAGRTIDRSIWDAKEISVNFNKKGAGDKFLGAEGQTMLGNVAAGVSGAGRAGYIFWNAALQGTFGNFLKYAMRYPGKMGTVVASWCGLAMLVTALASAGGDDDDDSYYDIPEHTRRQNLIVKGPGNAWIKIPLPIEYRAVYAMGELTGSSLFHNEKLEVSDVLAQMSQLLPVDMMEGTKALWPSSVKPMVEVSNNESWYGSPIWKDTPYNKYMPNWTKAYKSANKDLVNLSETLNEVSGGSKYRKGTIDLNPAAIEYLLKQYTGGFFTVTNQIRNLINVGTGEKDFDWRYVPLANRMLMSGGDERNVGRGLDEKFFGYLDAYRAKASEFSAIKGDLSLPLEKKAELISEIIIDPEYVKMKGMERIYSKLKKAYDTAKEIGDTSKAEELEKRINELKRKFILEMEQDERK
ncbi:LPD38 domain-containing protein [Bacteroides ovatus]|uniref:LPD38 domain-containing protein n=1 Tax=Bacteroides ovatus TaxID=28116 RepID=UPI002165C725|nr:LPD38 domain-containing protein [Bacteroides ovatus]MCS3035209.1 DEAD/DEAH box helicase family protein [Bacteroides ovatus]